MHLTGDNNCLELNYSSSSKSCPTRGVSAIIFKSSTPINIKFR